MCELFALSSSSATEVSFSLDEFSKHGGLTNHHRHGWGIAYYEQNTARIIKEASQASSSLCLDFIKGYSMRSTIIMSHIRYATQGKIRLANTQPFSRELAGKQHVFTHNGNLTNIVANPRYKNIRFKPMGETDSEAAFCYLMHLMVNIWDAPRAPSIVQRYQVFNYFAEEMHALGLANFIYSDSEYIFVYSHKREVKKNDKDMITLPGLHFLHRKCQIDIFDTKIKGLKTPKKQPQSVVLISSVPLNDENWIVLKSQQSMVLKDGEIVEIG